MNVKVFGFLGVDCYDVIYYAAQTAKHLGHSSLIVDLSSSRSASYLYQGDYQEGDIVDVNGVSLVYGKLHRGVMSDYEYIFINYGFTSSLLDLCHEIYIVSDCKKNNVDRLKSIDLPDVPRYLVLRDSEILSISNEYFMGEFSKFDIGENEFFILSDTDDDRVAQVYLQYSRNVKLGKLSNSLCSFIEHMFDVDASKQDIARAWKLVKKG